MEGWEGFCVDPLTKDFSRYTPYQFAGNTPIWAIDLDGTEEKKMSFTEKWKLLIEIVINKLAQHGNDIREIEGERRGNADQGLAKVVEHYSNQLMLAHAHVEMTQNATSGAKGRPTNSSTIASQADDLAFVSVLFSKLKARIQEKVLSHRLTRRKKNH